MIVPTRIWEYLLASILIIIAPGPSVLFVIARAIAWGRKTAVFTVVGNAVGAYVLSIFVALGLGPVLQRSNMAYSIIQWGGGAYLIYLGVDAIRHREIHAADMTQKTGMQPASLVSMRDGFWVGVLNPKTLVFFAAVIPQFIDRDRGHVTAQLLLLGALFIVLALISDGSWGLLAGTARQWLATDTGRLIKLRTSGGAVMIALGVLVIISAIRHSVS
ncbi:MAG: LysE family translocator [Candidatus Nanopelagicaceae bacterium]|nr:LysE family translocator [Candidatus Nanopelagicaceae bacterium]